MSAIIGVRKVPWPEDSPCYKCGAPVGKPWSERLIPNRPVCPRCAWDNINAALNDDTWGDAHER